MEKFIQHGAITVLSISIALTVFGVPKHALAAALTYTNDTTITIGNESFTISSGSEATSLALGSTNLIVTVPTGSTFTLVSPNRRPLDNNASIAESCTASENELAVTGAVTVTITPDTDGTCTTSTTTTSLSIRLARIFGTQQNNTEGSSGGTSSAPPPAPAPSPPAETPVTEPSPVVLPNEPAPSTLPSDPVVNFPGIPRIISDSVLGRATPSAATEQLRVGTFSYGAARVSSLKSESVNAGVLSDHLHEQFSAKVFNRLFWQNVDSEKGKRWWYTYVNAYVYGGYPLPAIKQSVKFGGKTVHPTIPWSLWKDSQDYKNYIDR